MKTIFLVALMSAALNVQASETMKADAEAINSACTQDSATAGCGSEKVGSGLLKCLHAFKKSHSEFKFSDGCKTAMKKMHQDRKESKH